MKFPKILTSALLGCLLLAGGAAAQAQPLPLPRTDEVLLQMSQAFRRGDRDRLAQLLPLARGHALEPWAAYWELRARLDVAQPAEVDAFLARWAGSYQEDRLRNDWLRLLGQRRDWSRFAELYPQFRMNDDREVRCYALLVGTLRSGAPLAPEQLDELRRNWWGLRDADDGCTLAASELYSARQLTAADVWRKARLAMDANRPRVARSAVEIVAPEASSLVTQINDNPMRFLLAKATASGATRKELVALALLKMGSTDPDTAAAQLEGKWGVQITAEERNWVWGAIGRQAATRLSPMALEYYAKVSKDADLTDDMLAWKARAALRAGNWREVLAATAAMDAPLRNDSTWIYWRARALLGGGPLEPAPVATPVPAEAAAEPASARVRGRPSEAQRAEAQRLFESIASPRGFYEQLALEELGQRIVLPQRPPPPTPEEREAVRANPSLARGLYAIQIGLRSEGVREWNYATNLHLAGGMGERELLAAAELACQNEVWDRCINTSERTRTVFDVAQRFPMPHQAQVVQRSRAIGIDPAYVYGLIRQESRFIMDARSGVGASGLMQVMPATARWTARKIGIDGFRPEQINERDTNIAIGTAYLKLALDDFQDSMPLAAAAYNAGPGRPRVWRNGPVLDAAIWAENIPFGETRDYVKKVLANTTTYAAILSGQPQSLKARLGTVGPRDAGTADPSKDLP
ncbi:lytic transglycosylase domain-containing protein [Xylophilus sp. ASV27]|uniref:lytic transglycosylase domain-containing protein n=1 Tax=Xylophilus sp. ASV27 TaxID=2795129 RepID=UPI0018EAE0BB|nr:lytic transglycosylase domain-containing protein [Xylophilus sp. ASV27]